LAKLFQFAYQDTSRNFGVECGAVPQLSQSYIDEIIHGKAFGEQHSANNALIDDTYS
jgi:hypothetical protein